MKTISLMAALALTGGTMGSIVSAAPEVTGPFTPAQEKAVETIIERHLTAHPDVIAKALQALQAQQMKAELEKGRIAVLKNKGALFSKADDPVGGNPNGSKVLVLFMDPYCGHCRHFQTVVDQAVQIYPDLKLIYKELPILGEPSQLAASAFFAALAQGQSSYTAFMKDFLKTDGAQSKDQLIALAKGAGLDQGAFTKALDSTAVKERIKANMDLADALGISATPSLVLDDILIPGGVPMEVLKKLLDAKKPDINKLSS